MKFTVLQWNIDYTESIEAIAHQLQEWSPDILCLQELTHGWQKAHLDTGAYLAQTLSLQGETAYGLMTLPTGEPAHMGVGILSRFPITKAQRIVIQPGAIASDGTITNDERSYLDCQLNLGNRKLTIGTVHLPFHPRFRSTPHKQAIAGKLLERQQEIDGNYLLCGDFNATPGTQVARTVRHGMRNGGPAWRVPTWTTKPFAIGPWRYDTLAWRLDYLLYKGALQRTTTAAVATRLSDHVPLLATFEI
jgi:endonuclease/exonuclease/phosphatase family metal-dependent hydrolase